MKPQTINYIFRENSIEYLKLYPYTTLMERKVIRSIGICRTKEMGGRVEQCDICGHRVVLYNSCRNRHCPQCQNMKKEQWILDRKNEVLPFTYFHIVFTLPDSLNSLIWRNKRILFTLMFQISKDTLLSASADEKYFGANIGFFSILHTWGQQLNRHPHLHCVVPGGGFSQKKQQWIHAPYNYLIPVEVLKVRFRSLFLTALKKLYSEKSLYLAGTPFEHPRIFQRLIDSLFKKEWVIYLKESFQNTNSVIDYLARYTHRIAISNHRIISTDNTTVSFKYRDYKDNNKEKIMQLDTISFMRRFMFHVVPYRFVRIRYFGILSHRNKKNAIAVCREFYSIENNQKKTTLNWRELFLIKTGRDCSQCPACQKGTLIISEIIPATRYRAPPYELFELDYTVQ